MKREQAVARWFSRGRNTISGAAFESVPDRLWQTLVTPQERAPRAPAGAGPMQHDKFFIFGVLTLLNKAKVRVGQFYDGLICCTIIGISNQGICITLRETH